MGLAALVAFTGCGGEGPRRWSGPAARETALSEPRRQTAATTHPSIRDGDIVFHTSRSSQSLAIQKATRSPYSHMGIVFVRDGRPFVLEAISTVRETPLEAWVARGTGGRYVVKRLRGADRILTPESVRRLREAAEGMKGRPYDLTFEWSDERIYCSELVWKAYERALGIRVGELRKLRDFDLTPEVVRERMKERYGDRIPMDEPVISPVAMLTSPLLEDIAPDHR
jgi:hypothetical protein